MHKYENALYRYACITLGSSEDADDVVQETFIAYSRCAMGFKNDRHLQNWLYKVAGNRCRNILRSRKRHESVRIEDAESKISEVSFQNEEGALRNRERADVLLEHVQRLPDNLREVIFLRYYDELGIPRIAEIVGISTSAVYMRLHRARAALKKMIEEGNGNG